MAPTAVLESCASLGNRLAVRVGRSDGSWTCQPGQFFLLRTGALWTPYLRRALFPTAITPTELSFLIQPSADPGMAWLAAQSPGAGLDLIGPLGSGFVTSEHYRRVLLVAESAAVAPLLALISPALARQASVALLLQASSRADLLPAGALAPAVEYYTACEDPMDGQPATLDDDLIRALVWADSVCAAGSTAFLRRVKTLAVDARYQLSRGFAQVVAPVSMPCGIGACLACLIDTGRGLHRACVRGPVFDLGDLVL